MKLLEVAAPLYIYHFPLLIIFKRNIEESKRNCKQTKLSKCRMLLTRNMMDDCEFIDTSGIPTILSIVMDLREAKDCVDVDVVKMFTNRNVLRISYRWSKKISWKRKCEDSMGSLSIDGGLYNIDQSFRSECADLEVEAISVMLHWKVKWKDYVY